LAEASFPDVDKLQILVIHEYQSIGGCTSFKMTGDSSKLSESGFSLNSHSKWFGRFYFLCIYSAHPPFHVNFRSLLFCGIGMLFKQLPKIPLLLILHFTPLVTICGIPTFPNPDPTLSHHTPTLHKLRLHIRRSLSNNSPKQPEFLLRRARR
jgi:hypothetical protein